MGSISSHVSRRPGPPRCAEEGKEMDSSPETGPRREEAHEGEPERAPKSPNTMAGASSSRSLVSAAGTVAGLTLVSRILGLVRDMLMASVFGLGMLADAFYLAWTLPNLFRRLCGEGALSLAFLPIFVKTKDEEGQEAARRLAQGTVTWLGLILALVVVVLELAVGYGELRAGSGPGAEEFQWTLRLAAILLPYLWFICLAGLISGVLHSAGDFARPAGMAVVLNIVWIAALVLGGSRGLGFGPEARISLLAGALVFGGLLQFGLLVQGSAHCGFPLWPRFERSPALFAVGASFMPIAFGLAIEQLNVVFDRLIAWILVPEAGAVAALYYSMRLIQLPIALLGTALNTVLFPSFARQAAAGERVAFQTSLDAAVRITIFTTLPAAVGLCVIGPELIALLFERGGFGAAESARTATCLMYYAGSVLMISLTATQVRAYYAHQDKRTPVRVGAAAVVLNLLLNLVLVGWLREAGLALGTTISASFSFCLLAYLSPHGRLQLRSVGPALGRALGLAALMAAACLLTKHGLATHVGAFAQVSVSILVGVGVYGGLARLLRVRELRDLFRMRASGALE